MIKAEFPPPVTIPPPADPGPVYAGSSVFAASDLGGIYRLRYGDQIAPRRIGMTYFAFRDCVLRDAVFSHDNRSDQGSRWIAAVVVYPAGLDPVTWAAMTMPSGPDLNFAAFLMPHDGPRDLARGDSVACILSPLSGADQDPPVRSPGFLLWIT